ncbi:transient receptor potential cation channel subfamily A member 1-like [Paramuricea clavata]|uniref:Transient receptor potential cation channel subfamily A member 1-like n=1 Tax=Paramuricea clavata TaxID=317549 RepID=A0A7D9HSH1_PARCT|nr:transient receptor potential cation channel subfamily A member 1-like [Paramuricea clavata]
MSGNNEKAGLLNGKNKLQAVTFGTKLEDPAKKISETDEPDEPDKKYTRRSYAQWETKKLYEIMLMEDIPEDKRPNTATYAVLDSELGKREEDDQDSTDNVRDQALLQYLANLAKSNKEDDVFNFEFVESLVQDGANINCMDTNGQTIFHEVARSWNVDVARFLVEKGANVNHQDKYGRSPLHVAAAVDYANMVEFIVENGGNIDIKTNGEGQTAIHYAAKNDAVNSLQMLLDLDANIDFRDSRNRTPLQVAAEMNSFKAAKLLVTAGAPAGVFDEQGNSALSLLIEKIPEVALIALDQFHTTDNINRREFYFLNYLEGAKLKEELQETKARSPLEIAVQNESYEKTYSGQMEDLWEERCDHGHGFKSDLYNALDYSSCDNTEIRA